MYDGLGAFASLDTRLTALHSRSALLIGAPGVQIVCLSQAERSVLKVAKTIEDLNPVTKFVAGANASTAQAYRKENQQNDGNP